VRATKRIATPFRTEEEGKEGRKTVPLCTRNSKIKKRKKKKKRVPGLKRLSKRKANCKFRLTLGKVQKKGKRKERRGTWDKE